jgi:hypothetical protein
VVGMAPMAAQSPQHPRGGHALLPLLRLLGMGAGATPSVRMTGGCLKYVMK